MSLVIQIIAVGLIVIFYVSLLAKLIKQRTRGIKNIKTLYGKKTKNALFIERLCRFAILSIIFIEIVSICFDTSKHIVLSIIGLCIAFVGVTFFIAALKGLKTSWRLGINEEDEIKLITTGIYKYTRNPSSLGYMLIYIGIYLAYPNVFHLIYMFFAVICIHLQNLQEEKLLTKKFGQEYLDYKKNTRRY